MRHSDEIIDSELCDGSRVVGIVTANLMSGEFNVIFSRHLNDAGKVAIAETILETYKKC